MVLNHEEREEHEDINTLSSDGRLIGLCQSREDVEPILLLLDTRLRGYNGKTSL